MSRLSEILNDIYKKFLPLAENAKVELNIDVVDPNEEVGDDAEALKSELELQLKTALSKSDEGTIGISVKNGAVVLSDSGTILSPTFCSLLSTDRVQVKSRVGFGTTITIPIKKDETTNEPKKLPAKKSKKAA